LNFLDHYAPKPKKPPPKSSKHVASYKSSINKAYDKGESSTSKSGRSDAASSSVFSGISFNKKSQRDNSIPKQPTTTVNKSNQPKNSNISSIAITHNKPSGNTQNNYVKNSSNSSNGKLVIGDALKKTPAAASTKPTHSTFNKYNSTPTATKNSASQGSVGGIKLGLSLPNKDKLKQVEDEEKELQRKLAEIQRKKQQLAGEPAPNLAQHQRGVNSSGQQQPAKIRSVPPMPAHLMTAAQRASLAANPNVSYF